MEVENYRVGELSEMTDLLYRTRQDTEMEDGKRRELCQHLGLLAQAEMPSLCPSLFYRELKGIELATWQRFLAARYRENHSDYRWSFAAYSFDKVPYECLQEIAFAKDTGLFSEIQIWTPEAIMKDPLAVGISQPGNRVFSIVRWGDALQPFADIFRQVWGKRRVFKVCFGGDGYSIPEQKYIDLSFAIRLATDEAGTLLVRKSRQRHCGSRMIRAETSHGDCGRKAQKYLVCSVCKIVQQIEVL